MRRLQLDFDALNDSMVPGVADRGRFEDEDRPRSGICSFGNKADHSKTTQNVSTDDSSQITGAGGTSARDGGSVTTIVNQLDQGSIGGAIGLAKTTIDSSSTNYARLLDAHSSGLGDFLGSLDSMLGWATDSQKLAALSTKEASSLVASAYQGSQDSADGNRTIVLVGLSVVGLIAVMMLFKEAK